MIADYNWIDDNSDLEQLILSLKSSDEVAFDSEFERINTFFPKPALFQLKINGRYFLIDMKKVTNHEVFQRLLDNIILHSGSEDLEILYNLNKQLPTHIFDTQIAASLCGYGLHYSYQNIVKQLFGVELSKAHSRSDWMQRPLSAEQIDYALEDVLYLPEIKSMLMDQLKQMKRVPWYQLLMEQRKKAIINSNHVDKTFIKTCKSKRFDVRQQKLLYALLNWREEIARKRDKPRQWILKNTQIVELVYKQPDSKAKLIDNIGLHIKFVEYNADSIFSLYHESESLNCEHLPQFSKLSSKQGEKFVKVKQQLNDVCEKLDIPRALIINNTDLKSLIAEDMELNDIEMWQLVNS